MRREEGVTLSSAIEFFGPKRTDRINLKKTEWVVTSRQLSLLLAPLGCRKMSGTDGVMRGEGRDTLFPFFHNSWRDKRATHEIWVGQTGYGKTFMLNGYLMREYALQGIPFDMLEPMGHGRHLAEAYGLQHLVVSAKRTVLNPHDVMFETPAKQKGHVIRLYETILGRPLLGDQQANLQRSLLGAALDRMYGRFGEDLSDVTPDMVPTVEELCDEIVVSVAERSKSLAYDFADELAGMCTGAGPYAAFVNGTTNMDLSTRGKAVPRIFSFHEMEEDMMSLAYTQVLSAIRRDSLADESPRIIAVDEVFRLMRHPSLLTFLVEAVKTFRTKRKKVICIDQNMSIFLEGDASLLFENCPIRVIFSQRGGMEVFEKRSFSHFTDQHKRIILGLNRFEYLMDIQDEGIWWLLSRPSVSESRRFGMT